MVSPTARPKPSMIAATMPDLEGGSTASLIISHRVAPTARAASRSSFGTVLKTSRQIAEMIGVIIKARMRPAVKKFRDEAKWAKNRMEGRWVESGCQRYVVR